MDSYSSHYPATVRIDTFPDYIKVNKYFINHKSITHCCYQIQIYFFDKRDIASLLRMIHFKFIRNICVYLCRYTCHLCCAYFIFICSCSDPSFFEANENLQQMLMKHSCLWKISCMIKSSTQFSNPSIFFLKYQSFVHIFEIRYSKICDNGTW